MVIDHDLVMICCFLELEYFVFLRHLEFHHYIKGDMFFIFMVLIWSMLFFSINNIIPMVVAFFPKQVVPFI